ncbi:DoxX family protein [Arachidicoccus terrestris]|uniref:DoxX family protein n=1 Tax=Arachidicoccus terrestris TaxID=2875539 RepID=UPI001CC5251C|nr:DoxX family protein [Arachidicoccus terrestris]UAY56427.1 DoxX family protein [Arachidicoccus terrestris]
MQKFKKITYWVATLWLSLGLVATGIVQIMHTADGVGGGDMMTQLGYPIYLMTLLGVLKILATVVLLLPRLSLAKQWAYAGIFFLVVGAIYSHFAAGGGFVKILPALLMGLLMVISWRYLPENRKVSVF